ncbi:MAG TPA: AAA family ATPase [Methanoregulaceae archaeon]|nr:MAG: flagellar hook-basal body complex protein FliE [Methanolinea sp.]HON80998.1 AAA family ATPase [Methanoregulaceae archaeon]HPD10196.1 AAA family ATPase [Methanoregulaceae archaeon]HRT14584.1 AAA family ATPase [Methanoregulaceae archaeon]HRU30155.1 AAA family ATPase [Methanoregulaceae archaeon]
MKVIGVVGLPASGKGELSRIARAMGIPVVVMGDVIRDTVIRSGLPVTDRNLGEMAGNLRKERGMAVVADLCIPEIERQAAPVVLVDGIRGDAEVDLFRSHFPGFILIGVDAPFEARLARLSSRGREDDRLDREELRERDRREISWGLGRALACADMLILNDRDLEAFGDQARQLLEGIREDKCR